MKCPKCGQICRTKREFCALCGTPLKQKSNHGWLIALIVILSLVLVLLSVYHFVLDDKLPALGRGSRPESEPETVIIVAETESEPAPEPESEGLPEAQARPAAQARPETQAQPEAQQPEPETPAPQALPEKRPGVLFENAAEIYAMPTYTLALCRDGSVQVAGGSASPEFGFDLFDWTEMRQLVPTDYFVAGLTRDGRVRLTGEVSGYEDAARWTDVTRLYLDNDCLLGLTAEGGVLAVGEGLVSDPSKLKNIVDIIPGYGDSLAIGEDGLSHLVRRQGILWDADTVLGIADLAVSKDFALFLMTDGSVRTGAYLYRIMDGYTGENPFYGWDNMQKLQICGWFVAGLTKDGQVVTATHLEGKAPDTSQWSGVVSLAADQTHGSLFGLTEDGRVLTTDEAAAQTVSSWENVQELQVNENYVAGLTRDGRVLTWAREDAPAPLEAEDWRDVTAISLGLGHLAALRADGSVLATGDNSFGQCG